MSPNATPGIGHNSGSDFDKSNRRIKQLLEERKRLVALQPHQRLRSVVDHVRIHASRLVRGQTIRMADGRTRSGRGDAALVLVLLAVGTLADNADGHCYAGVNAITEKAFPDETNDPAEMIRRRRIVEEKLATLMDLGILLTEERKGRSSLRVIAPTEPMRLSAEVDTSPAQDEGVASPAQSRETDTSPAQGRGTSDDLPGSEPGNLAKQGTSPALSETTSPVLSGITSPAQSEVRGKRGKKREDDMTCHELADAGATDLGLPKFIRPSGQGYVTSLRWKSDRTGKQGEKDFTVPVDLVKKLRTHCRLSDREARVLLFQTLEDWRERWVTGRKDHFLPDLLSDAMKHHEQLAAMEIIASEGTGSGGLSEEARRVSELLDSLAASDQELADEALAEQAEEDRRRGLH